MNTKTTTLIQSVQRSIDIINCFDEEHSRLTLNHISRKLSLNINTVRGLANTLVANDLLIHDRTDNTYSLGLFFVLKSNLVYSTGNLGNLVSTVHPYLEALSNRFDIFCSLQIVEQSKIFMVDAVNPEHAHYKITAQLYEPLALHCTSSGKLFLQYLKEPYRSLTINELNYESHTPKTIASPEELQAVIAAQVPRRYSIESEELALGISSIAAPVFTSSGNLFGTVSVTAITQVLQENLDAFSAGLLETAGKIELGLKGL